METVTKNKMTKAQVWKRMYDDIGPAVRLKQHTYDAIGENAKALLDSMNRGPLGILLVDDEVDNYVALIDEQIAGGAQHFPDYVFNTLGEILNEVADEVEDITDFIATINVSEQSKMLMLHPSEFVHQRVHCSDVPTLRCDIDLEAFYSKYLSEPYDNYSTFHSAIKKCVEKIRHYAKLFCQE